MAPKPAPATLRALPAMTPLFDFAVTLLLVEANLAAVGGFGAELTLGVAEAEDLVIELAGADLAAVGGFSAGLTPIGLAGAVCATGVGGFGAELTGVALAAGAGARDVADGLTEAALAGAGDFGTALTLGAVGTGDSVGGLTAEELAAMGGFNAGLTPIELAGARTGGWFVAVGERSFLGGLTGAA